MSDLGNLEYIKFNYNLIPPIIIKHYNLDKIANNGFAYVKFNEAWYRLKRSRNFAQDNLVKHLNKHGYIQAQHTNGLFVHQLQDISFTLVVNNFGIKYTNKGDVNHLIIDNNHAR